MSDFTVNVTNSFKDESITVSPLDAWGFGCCVPPGGEMNFSFKSESTSDSITLAIIPFSESMMRIPQISGIRTEGGTSSVKYGNQRPCLVRITNSGERSTTNVTIGSEPEQGT